ncbi:MAG: hypothetical protein ABR577_14390 [Pyrinomonadaceae bacterium]
MPGEALHTHPCSLTLKGEECNSLSRSFELKEVNSRNKNFAKKLAAIAKASKKTANDGIYRRQVVQADSGFCRDIFRGAFTGRKGYGTRVRKKSRNDKFRFIAYTQTRCGSRIRKLISRISGGSLSSRCRNSFTLARRSFSGIFIKMLPNTATGTK